MRYSIKELISEKITGEWGNEPIAGEGYKVIRTTNFTNYGIIDYEKIVVRDIDRQKVEKKHLKKGDIIIEKSGGSPAQPVGRVVFFDIETNEKFLCNNFTTILRPDKNLVVPKYLFYQLHIAYQRGITRKYQNKTTGIINLQLDKYLETKIEVPPLPDQLHIANVLSKAENLIAQRKESIRLLDEFLKSTFLEMFGDLKGEKVPLSTACIVNPKKSEINSMDKSIDVSFVPMAFVSENGEVDLSQTRKLGSVWNGFTYFRENDVVFAKITPCMENGKGAIMRNLKNKIGFGTTEFHVLRPIKGVSTAEWIYHLTIQHWFRKKAEQNMSGSAGQKRVPTDYFDKVRVVIPPLSLQTQFARIVEKTEALKTQYKQSLQELENLYGSLSQKAFRGELSV
jgi:type I restriction enzyme S subunit